MPTKVSKKEHIRKLEQRIESLEHENKKFSNDLIFQIEEKGKFIEKCLDERKERLKAQRQLFSLRKKSMLYGDEIDEVIETLSY
jgi:predicted RNase H-like nuclease (RuvC/YqgF family)